MEQSNGGWIEGLWEAGKGVYEKEDKFYPAGWRDLVVSLPIAIPPSLSLSLTRSSQPPFTPLLPYSHFVNLCEVLLLRLMRD